MIIHSEEYYHGLKKEMEDLRRVMSGKFYVSDIPFVNKGIDDEIKICEIALSSVKCKFCMHFVSNPEKPNCRVNGNFPSHIDPSEYSCINWVYEDIPF